MTDGDPAARPTPHWDSGETLADRFRAHAADATHLYGYAIRGMAEDWEAGGTIREVCRGYENAPRGALIQIRLLAGLFRLVLTGRAPELVQFYPCLGGTAPASEAWPLMREVIAAHLEEMHSALAVAPQTNEVGRSAALLAGLFDLVSASGVRRIRLLELGASAGLNLLIDYYSYRGESWQFGYRDSTLEFVDPIDGPLRAEQFVITDRAGCDVDPVDPTTADGRMLLTSFVWPFDLERHKRLRSALAVAATHPMRIDKALASSWLPEALATAGDDLPVVWHSITQMYWPAEEVAAVESMLNSYGARQSLGEVSMEFDLCDPQGVQPEVRTRLWRPDDSRPLREHLVGIAHYHGIPVYSRA